LAVGAQIGNGKPFVSAHFVTFAIETLGGHPKPAIDGHLKTGH